MTEQPDYRHPYGTALIAAERARQIHVKGYTPQHDAAHNADDLVEAGYCVRSARCGVRGGRGGHLVAVGPLRMASATGSGAGTGEGGRADRRRDRPDTGGTAVSARVHECPGCDRKGIPNRLLACGACWHRLPRELQRRIEQTAHLNMLHEERMDVLSAVVEFYASENDSR